jgi:hypothetical protein
VHAILVLILTGVQIAVLILIMDMTEDLVGAARTWHHNGTAVGASGWGGADAGDSDAFEEGWGGTYTYHGSSAYMGYSAGAEELGRNHSGGGGGGGGVPWYEQKEWVTGALTLLVILPLSLVKTMHGPLLFRQKSTLEEDIVIDCC